MASSPSRSATPRTSHLVGWAAVSGAGNAGATTATITRALDAFVGDFGRIRVLSVRNGFGYGYWKPEAPLPMTTWSSFNDARFTCFLEGVFYDDYGSIRIAEGEDPGLAQGLVAAMESEGDRAISRLSGSFAGFVFDAETRSLTTFVDRLGTKSLFWTQAQEGVIVCSNLAGFRGVVPLRLDLGSAFQFLTVGFPIGQRTLLDGVFTQPAASVNSFSRGLRKESRYWAVPERQETLKVRDAVARIAESMEGCVVRLSRRFRGRFGLGLTGGHDSRVIFSSLLYKDVPFEPVNWLDYNFNDRVVRQLCALARKEPHPVTPPSAEDLREIQRHAFVYADGQTLHSYGYTLLGQQCSIEGLEALIIGFGGDLVSGSAPVASFPHAESGDRLAQSMLSAQMELLSFRDAEVLLTGGVAGMGAETISLWTQSVEEERWRGSAPDASLWQRLQNRNVKRVRQVMAPCLQYVQALYPYLDNAVLDAYFSLPVRFLDQKPHCYAGFHRFPRFGDLAACGGPISLRTEARLPLSVYLLRLAAASVRAIKSPLERVPARSSWSHADELVYGEVAESPLFDSRRLGELVTRRRVKLIDLRKMQNLARFDRFYLKGDASVIPRSYLSD